MITSTAFEGVDLLHLGKAVKLLGNASLSYDPGALELT